MGMVINGLVFRWHAKTLKRGGQMPENKKTRAMAFVEGVACGFFPVSRRVLASARALVDHAAPHAKPVAVSRVPDGSANLFESMPKKNLLKPEQIQQLNDLCKAWIDGQASKGLAGREALEKQVIGLARREFTMIPRESFEFEEFIETVKLRLATLAQSYQEEPLVIIDQES